MSLTFFLALGSALDANALAEAFALHARFTATLAAAVGALAGPDVHRWAVRAKKLHCLPVTASAGLTPAQVDVILAHLSGRHLALFASHEASVVPRLVGLSVEDTATVMGQWRDRADHDDQVPPEPDRELHCSRTLEGRRVLTGHVDGDGGAVIDTALRLATTRDCPAPRP